MPDGSQSYVSPECLAAVGSWVNALDKNDFKDFPIIDKLSNEEVVDLIWLWLSKKIEGV